VFCWLEWDGDNILADGGVIDFGSVRQFGLYHRSYRFDDGPRWSTTLPQQRAKARYLVKCYAQARDFLLSGRRPPLAALSRDAALRVFDRAYRDARDRLLLRDAGFTDDAVALLLARGRADVRRYDRAHAFFERARSARGPVKVSDGLTWNAIFSVRDVLRELPLRFLERPTPIPIETFLALAFSTYASRRDRATTPRRRAAALEFQKAYLALVRRAARGTARPLEEMLREIARRSARINRYARLTGDASTYASARLVRHRRRLGADGTSRLIARFVDEQVPLADDAARPGRLSGKDAPGVRRALDALVSLVEECRHGI
jgi:hypothetical protein